jgi:hypothetical protein
MRLSVRHAASVLGAACFVLVAGGCSSSGEMSAAPATLAFVTDPADSLFGSVAAFPVGPAARVAFERGTPDESQAAFSVHVGDTLAAPMLGRWQVIGDTVRFHPRFAPAAGVPYVARWRSGSEPTIASWTWTPDEGVPSSMVAAIYPTADTLPTNILRMYVQFSAPMTTGRSYGHIRLYTNNDSLLEEPFFTGGDAIELWNPEKTRLTILFDPGRIKRDLLPHQQRGLPLQEGRAYRLVIDSSWHDAGGLPLLRSFEKRFVVGPMDRRLVRTPDWTLATPSAGGRDPLVVTFPEPLDHALLLRMLVVRDSSGATAVGEVAVSEDERRWSFTPRQPWSPGAYLLEVDTELEDLAGNNLRRLFDVAPGDSGAIGVEAAKATLRFRVR